MLRKGDSPSVVDIMLESLSSNSFKQYEVYLKRWFEYCTQKNLDVFNASIQTVTNFLEKLFKEGAQYGSLNSCRSALSLLLGNHIGQDERIKRFFKGVFRLRPPMPRYNETWDTSLVLNYLSTVHPNQNLPLDQLSKKLITLLALVTAHRVQTMSKINIDNISVNTDRITIKIVDLIKTSRPSSKQPLLTLPFFQEKPEICPAKCLQAYISLTAPLRKNVKNLFISLRSPYKAVTSQTLSRWIKSSLHDSGIDVTQFGAHSARHAATSAARRQGVSIDTIKRTAGWSESSNTFFKFYNRPLCNSTSNDQFAEAIINQSSND